MQEKWFPSTKYSNNNNKKYRENLTTDLISFFAVGVNFLWGFLFYLFVLWMGWQIAGGFWLLLRNLVGFVVYFCADLLLGTDWVSEWVCDGATDHSMLYNSSWHSLLAGYTEVFMPFYAYVLLLLYIVFPYAGTCFQVFILFMLSLLSFLLNFSIFQHFV